MLNQYNDIKKQIYKSLDNLNVADRVRVRMESLFSSVRSIIKQNNTKMLSVIWSPTIYHVVQVIGKRDVGHKRYVVGDGNGLFLRHSNGSKKYFKREDLQLANDTSTKHEDLVIDVDDALKLNKSKRSLTDIVLK